MITRKKQKTKTPPDASDIERGAKIRMRRIEQHMSQAELGKQLGVTFQQVQKYEKGTNRVSATRITEIAQALDIGVSYFMEPSDTKSESNLIALITDSASQRLLRAFHKIKEMPTRYKVVGLLEAITSDAA